MGTTRPGAKWARASPAHQPCRAWAGVAARMPALARPGYLLGTEPARDNTTLATQIFHSHRTMVHRHGRLMPSLSLGLSLSLLLLATSKWRLNPSPNLADRRWPPHLARSSVIIVASSSSVWPLLGYSVVTVASPVEPLRNRRTGATSLPLVIHIDASVCTRSFLPQRPPLPSSRARSSVVVVRSSHR
jgi:hypothetical protein